MTPSKGTPRQFRQIPNRQIVDAAEQFHDACSTMRGTSGVLLAQLHCAFIALELYLKALSATEVEVALTMGVSSIHAESAANTHKLEALYDLADPKDQAAIEAEFSKRSRLSAYPSGREALKKHNGMFMSSRYPFEADSSFDDIEMGVLYDLLDALKDAVNSVPLRHVR